MHEEGAVAAHRHAGPVGRGELGAEHAGDAEAHRRRNPCEPISESGRRGLQNWISQL